jgi:hypothetical protein
MSDASSRLAAALSDRYRLERAAESRGSADVAEATGGPGSRGLAAPPRPMPGRFSGLSRAATEGPMGAHRRDPDPRESSRVASATTRPWPTEGGTP